MTTKNKPIKHHYLPKFYLKEFVDNNLQINVFDRYSKKYMKKTPGAIAYSKNFYTVDTVVEKGSTVLEEVLSKIESVSKPILEKLKTNGNVLSDEERENFSLFLAMQHQRVPDREKEKRELLSKNYKQWAKRMAQFYADNPKAFEKTKKKLKFPKGQPELTKEDLLGLVSEEKYTLDLDISHSYVVKQMFVMALETAPYLYEMDWTVIFAPRERAFITTDNPFIITGRPTAPRRGVGLISLGSRKFFTLSPKVCLQLGYKPERTLEYRNATLEGTKHINNLLAIYSDRYIFSNNESLLRRVIKTTKVDTFVREERVLVG